MPAVVVSTVGGATSNAYVSLAEAEAFAAEHLAQASWTAADTDTKNRAIITATRELDRRIEWDGGAASTTQRLSWPRSGLVDRNGNAIDSDELPYDLKVAAAEYARVLVERDYTADDAAARDGLKKVKAGSVEIEFTEARRTVQAIPDTVWSLVSLWGRVIVRSAGMATLVRT